MQIDHVEISKLELEPGDLLVVKVKGGERPAEFYDNVTRAIEHAMQAAGVRAPILIGPDTVEFSAIRAPKVTA